MNDTIYIVIYSNYGENEIYDIFKDEENAAKCVEELEAKRFEAWFETWELED